MRPSLNWMPFERPGSSWSAALAQLPGFPDKTPLPGLPPRGAQAVSPLGKDADETDEPGTPEQ